MLKRGLNGLLSVLRGLMVRARACCLRVQGCRVLRRVACLLGGSWVVLSGVYKSPNMVVALRITLLITSHEPPSRPQV